MASDCEAERNTNMRRTAHFEMVSSDCVPTNQSEIEPFSGNGWQKNHFSGDHFVFLLVSFRFLLPKSVSHKDATVVFQEPPHPPGIRQLKNFTRLWSLFGSRLTKTSRH
jgi:hypothetical protein